MNPTSEGCCLIGKGSIVEGDVRPHHAEHSWTEFKQEAVHSPNRDGAASVVLIIFWNADNHRRVFEAGNSHDQ
jgi:hypothetical protein